MVTIPSQHLLDEISLDVNIIAVFLLRWSEVSLLVAELRAIGGVIRLSMVELEDEGGEGESAKGKRGTPLRGGGFYHSPLCALLSLSLANCRRK